MTTSPALAIYIHWPYCKSKCPYCDFNSHVTTDPINIKSLQQSYQKEIDYFTKTLNGKTITSIFFGGGTPSLMPPQLTETLIDYLAKKTALSTNCEITLEANPTSIESNSFTAFQHAGINRFSLGIQALNDQDLAFLGREHSSKEAIEAIERAATCTDNYSFDLIYARPNQTETAWKQELEKAISLATKHLSLYQLTIEKGTPFFSLYNQKHFSLPNSDQAANLFTLTQEITEKHHFQRYETSNHAIAGYESKHNLAYWRYQEYLGLGPGAHSRITHNNTLTAFMNRHHPDSWQQQIAKNGHAIQQQTPLNKEEQYNEHIMMRLRLTEGIPTNLLNTPKHTLESLLKENLLIQTETHTKTTEKGALVLNSIIEKLVA